MNRVLGSGSTTASESYVPSFHAEDGLSFLPFFREGRKTKKSCKILLILSKNEKREGKDVRSERS